MAYTKLFQKILASSIWNEDVYTKVVWITMLAMKDQNQIVSASIGGLAHLARVPIEECRKAIEKLEGPDPDDSSGVREGRRIEPLEHDGWLVINGAAYRDSKDEDERRAWMANYMREYRKRKQNVNNRKHPLTPVNTAEQSRAEENRDNVRVQDEGYGEKGRNEESFRLIASGEASQTAHRKVSRNKSPMMSNAVIKELETNPAYKGIDVINEAFKFKTWCEKNQKTQTVRRFVNWLNRV